MSQWNRETKTVVPRPSFDSTQAAVVVFDNAFHAGEADAFPRHFHDRGVLRAAEDVKQLRQVFLRDAHAGVFDAEESIVSASPQDGCGFPRAIGSHVLDAVVDQVLEHLPHAHSFAVHDAGDGS